jgi:hypothetical protein
MAKFLALKLGTNGGSEKKPSMNGWIGVVRFLLDKNPKRVKANTLSFSEKDIMG